MPQLCLCEFWTCPQCSSVPAVVLTLGGGEGAEEGWSALSAARGGVVIHTDGGRLWGTHWADKSLLRVRAERVSALGAHQSLGAASVGSTPGEPQHLDFPTW